MYLQTDRQLVWRLEHSFLMHANSIQTHPLLTAENMYCVRNSSAGTDAAGQHTHPQEVEPNSEMSCCWRGGGEVFTSPGEPPPAPSGSACAPPPTSAPPAALAWPLTQPQGPGLSSLFASSSHPQAAPTWLISIKAWCGGRFSSKRPGLEVRKARSISRIHSHHQQKCSFDFYSRWPCSWCVSALSYILLMAVA